MREPLFSRPVIVLILAWAVALFAMSIILGARDSKPVTADRAGAGTYSVSAVGYAGFFDLLRRFEFPAVRGLHDVNSLAGADGTLIVADPDMSYLISDSDADIMSARRVLIVMPKRNWVIHDERPEWVIGAGLKPAIYVEQTLMIMTGKPCDVVRKEWPEYWPINEVGRTPEGSGAVQLIRSEEIRTIVGDEDGALLGEISDDERKIWILSDPDVMANHGIVKGENALFMLDVTEGLSRWENDDPTSPIVFDETVHGFRRERNSLLKLLLRFPFAVVIILICCSSVLVALAGVSRYGAPRARIPSFEFGKSKLIDNSARLLDYGGHHAIVIDRYIRMTIRNCARNLHAPENLDERATAEWLDRIGHSRGVKLSCTSILNTLSELNGEGAENLPKLFETAFDIFRWKGEILIGGTSIYKRNS
ncbi:MAG: DUF4350 domain-containing protein [Synergistaceae bacterium]|jgi:hypothetical protein|nr:DUF4350 domain-containing protein [Synergistaceae bacterium]